jgi:hypothetical protein
VGTEYLTLKWGTLKAWDFQQPKTQALFKEWCELGWTWSADGCVIALWRMTPRQKELICEIIDALDAETVHLDWDGVDVSKEDAKRYVMEYNR